MKKVSTMNRFSRYQNLWIASLTAFVCLSSHLNQAYANTVKGVTDKQSFTSVQARIKDFLVQHSTGFPGETTIEVGNIDPRVKLSQCEALEIYFPVGSKAWGKTSVGARCNAPEKWNIYVQAQVKVEAAYLIAAAPLAQGRLIETRDLTYTKGDITALPSGIITNPDEVLGKKLSASIGAGVVIRSDMLRSQTVVKQGQTVRLISAGKGFRITAEALAMADAGDGQVVRAKTTNGNIVSGIATQGGEVNVSF
jgi:flagellar basal body P-ring formation protein FlgA